MAESTVTSSFKTIGSSLTNYARIERVTRQVFPEILQEILVRKKNTLHSDVLANSVLSKSLNPNEWSMINNARIHGYVNFDIPLCYKLIRYLNLVPSPSKGWNDRFYPKSEEITPGDDVARIRTERYRILHRLHRNVSDVELVNYFVLFKGIAGRIEIYLDKQTNDFSKAISYLESCELQENTEKIYIERTDFFRQSKFVKQYHSYLNEDSLRDEIRIILVGKTGSGKSATGNSILGTKCFESKTSASSVTIETSVGECLRNGIKYRIIDTPGFFGTLLTNESVIREIEESTVATSTRPYAVVLVVRIGRLTREDLDAVDYSIDLFGENIRKRMIILFTGKDHLSMNKQSIDDYIQLVPGVLREILKQGEYIAFDNNATGEEMASQIDEFFRAVEKVVPNYNTNTCTKLCYPNQISHTKLEGKKDNEDKNQSTSGKIIEKEKIIINKQMIPIVDKEDVKNQEEQSNEQQTICKEMFCGETTKPTKNGCEGEGKDSGFRKRPYSAVFNKVIVEIKRFKMK